VGKCVRALEQHLGVRLLHRTTRRQSLTDIGRTYYERARAILAEVEAADSLAAETLATPRGRIRVPVKGRLMIDSGEAMLAAAKAGLGLMMQPIELVQTELAAGRLVRVLTKYKVPTRPLHMLHAPDARMTPKLRSFLDFAAHAFGA